MRCPTCGHVGADRVCQLCGNNMVDDVILEEQTVVCLGLLEDEIPCAAQLTEELRFCSPCDKKEHVEISLNINVHEDDVNGKNGLHNVTDTPIVVLKETDSSGKSLNTNNVANVFVPENVRRVSLCEESKTVGIDKETEHVNNAKRTENITFDQEAKNVNYEIREMEMDNKNGTRNLEIKNEKEDVDNNNERGNVEVGNGKRNESNNNEAGTVENENERENVDTESKTGNIDSGKESGTVDNENKGNDDAENEKGNLDSGNESGNLDRDNGSGTMENENERGNVDTENKIENANNDDERKNVNNNSYTENADNANERRNLDNKNEKGKVENEKKTKNVDNENEAGNENGKMNVGNDNDTETGTVDTDNETGHFDNWNEKRNVRKENEIGTVEYKNTTITFDNENETGNVENDAGAERNKLETGNSDYEYGTKNLVKEKVTVTMDDENKIGEECPTVSNQRDLDSKQAAHQRSTKVKQPVADKKSGGKQGNANKNTAETQNKERSISKRQSNTTAKNERDTDTIEVHFHVLLSTNIKFVPKTDQAVIRFGSQFFGGWDAELILQHVRTHDTGEEELHTSILIPRTLVVGKNVEYKYYIKRFSKTTKGKRRKDIWEDYLIHEKSGPGKNRRLTVPDRFKKSETWNQFDGLVQKTNKEKFMTKLVGKANRIIFGPTQLKSNAVRAMEIFSGQIVDELKRSTDGDSVLQSAALLDSLNYCLWRVYVVDNSCWDSGEKLTKDVAYYVTAPLVERLLNFLSKLADNAEIAFTDRMFATMAVLVVENRLLKTSSLLTETPSHLNQICISLLPSSPATGTSCKEFDFLKQHFLEQIDMVTNLLVRLVKLTAQQNKNPVWLFLMPLIHFLSGACEPFEPVKYDMSHDRDNSAWWGIARLGKNIIAQFKCQNDSWKLPLGEVIERLAPCFPMDYMLPRTIMACLNPMEVNEAIQTGFIPLEVSCSTIIYLIKTSKVTTTQSIYPRSLEMTTIEEQVTFHCMQSLIDALLKDNTSANDQLSEVSMLLQHGMTIEMTKEALKDNKLIPVFASIKLLLYAQSQLIKNQKSKQIEQDSMDLEDISSNVCRYFATLCCHFSLDMDFQMLQWDQALVADDLLCDETTKTAWNNSLLGCLQQQLTKFVKESCWHTKAYVEYYCKNVHKFKSCLQKCMSKIAFEAIDQAYELDFYLFTKVEKERFGCLLCEMLKSSRSKLLQTDVTEENVSLQPCLSWSPLPQFVKIYKSNWKCKQGGIFDEESKVLLTIVISKLEASYHFLREGNITISDLRAIHQQDRVYADLVQTIIADEKNQLSTKTVLQLIEIRMKELDSFKEHTVWMSTMVGLCQCKKNVDLSEVHDVLSRQEDLGTHCLSELCDTADVRNLSNLKDYKPRITAFKVSDELLNALPFIHKCNDSLVFLKMWNNQCANNNDEKCTIEDVFENIWNPVRESWENTCLSIQQGDIKFCDMETLIGSVYRDDYEKIKEELKRLGLNKSQVEERLDQLKQFRELTKCSSGANSLLKISKVYKLSGSFEKIQKIANYDSQDFCMREFDSSLINTCDFLKELTIEKCRCLDVFVKCGNLVNWLRESMSEPGLKELKVFVDLAFMSAGDEPINIACVQYLHSAVTGYAPLIFDLKPTDGYEKLTDYCSTIWKELEANPNLADQLLDTSRRLEWLKQIKETHGSIEVTSLCQAEAINDNGIYQVGSSVQKGNGVFRQLDQEKAVSLTVTDKSDKGNRRKYTCEQLQDLQSRLMLVAGKAVQGNSSVERFTEIFDSVNRLSNVYVKLCQAGCALFSNWTATLFCDTKSDVCVILKFGTGELKGRRNKTEDLQCLIPQLAGFMERCYEEWLKYIKDKRKDYEHLNYFTVDQLVILQKELVKLSLTDEPSHLIYPLLSAVKRNCTKSELMEAMNKAKASLSKECGPDLPLDELSNKSSLEKTLDEDKEGSFIQEMLDNDFSESLARKALAEVGSDNVSEGITWCMEHSDTESEGDESVVNNDMERGDQVAVFDRWSQATESIQKVISSRVASLSKDERSSGVKPFLEEIQQLWSAFLGSLSTDMSDYLNLEHLGKILKVLAKNDTFSIERKFPPGFEEGLPNLVICPQGEILHTTLGVYMIDCAQPLPQSDEVLLCTHHTTADEVENFLRRALFHGAGKIHCLVNADLLDFNVSEASEQSLEEFIKEIHGKEANYRLIVICGSENENRSRIVASLFKHRRSTVPPSTKLLKKYLSDQLRVPESFGVKPAASVDFNRSSVRLIKSWRAGVGKTLYKNRTEQRLYDLNGNPASRNVSIPLTDKTVDIHQVVSRLLKHMDPQEEAKPRIIHFDLANEVLYGADFLLFNLLVLGCLVDSSGFVWRKSCQDLYLVETMPLMDHYDKTLKSEVYSHQMLALLPEVVCRSPRDSVYIYNRPQQTGHDQLFDKQKFASEEFQRPFQYLIRLDQGQPLNDINPRKVEGKPLTCLETLLKYCGVHDPSWAELHHFVSFLNTQLSDFERNEFVGSAAEEDLPGFSQFVLQFLIQMSKDFSTRSLNISEESHPQKIVAQDESTGVDDGNSYEETEDTAEREIFQRYQLRRTWETSPHPYLFFNADRTGFTFLGFYLERRTGSLVDEQSGTVLQKKIITQNLFDALVRNKIPLKENFDNLSRADKITKLCSVMGNDMPSDPDDTYELTTDNTKKIMAIFMRFRCNIPVIIMGETGCGKTRLVKFMCSLQCPPGVYVNNMILMKVHGGTTKDDIKRKVEEAEKVAQQNTKDFGSHFFTVLFFDEANTTEAIGIIKNILCDRSLDGEKLSLCDNLKIVAACNPYRKHSDELIQKLEQAGLGYHIKAEDTADTLGRVPMRQLVYRVQPLPQSLLPLVWDFGQLNSQVEDLYIRQMVRRYVRDEMLPGKTGLPEVISSILTASQEYMRQQKDECSFVSLRDVDRALCVMSWFYHHNQKTGTLFEKMDLNLGYNRQNMDLQNATDEDTDEYEDDDNAEVRLEQEIDNSVSDVTRCLVLSLGVCYHACLRTRDEYKRYIAKYFREPCKLPGGSQQIDQEINACQEVFLENIHLEKNIAKNMALKENVFMMVVCIELRIPLFLVGKPGSSKSLAKTVVADAMQGNASREQLFRELKQAQMVSFQCSPLSTPDGIVGTFRQCSQFQKDKDLDAFVSIVVLDEVGLAEDSPRMPLKTLHPLLEDGCQGDETPEPHKKVAFIGISNWSLDPAKMNRGILVQREVPNTEELQSSARGICESGRMLELLEPLIKPLAKSYLEIFGRATDYIREFYGLRDFYSLIKMVNMFVERSKRPPSWHELVHAIRRNFGGMDQVDPVECFKYHVYTVVPVEEKPQDGDPDCSTSGLIEDCLFDKIGMQSESRYLLLLTENIGALTVLQQQVLSRQSDIRPITIFGSSFRSDQEYTQVCRNINKIKVCMETGNTVILLNLENLYESLYDALNQYYVYFGGERYVDLGLGTHRVKCPVHPKFRLIVVAEKQTVYNEFPIPLINRLEKHFFTINTMLTDRQQDIVKKLEEWVNNFATQKLKYSSRKKMRPDDVFMGYHEDTCSAVILHVDQGCADDAQVLLDAKQALLWCASPDGVVRLGNTSLSPDEQNEMFRIYHREQSHGSLVDYLHQQLIQNGRKLLIAQVTTHSKLLASFHKHEISRTTRIPIENILLLNTLTSFDTEQQFSSRLFRHFKRTLESPSLLIVQCDSGEKNANLIACARYCVMDEYEKARDSLIEPAHIVFIVQLSHSAEGSFSGFQSGIWHSVHIDDLYTEDPDLPNLMTMHNKSIATLLREYTDQKTVPAEEMPSNDFRFSRSEDKMTDCTSKGYSTTAHSSCQKLILRCLHLALSMVKDSSTVLHRATKRISILLELINNTHEKGCHPFLNVLIALIVKLLEERDKKLGPLSQLWLKNEAASQETLQKSGTFRRACTHTVESKIAPVLAGIIAYLDTNKNLNLISDTASPWQKQVWLAFINHQEMSSLKYADLVSPLNENDLPEFTVRITGCEGHKFKANIPFSWEIHDFVETILSQYLHQEFQGTTEDKLDWCRNLLSKSIGRVLVENVSTENLDVVVDGYISDLVHMKYQAACLEEHNIVCDLVRSAQHCIMKDSDIVLAIVCSHMAIRIVAKQLISFRAICEVWPGCSQAYILSEKPPNTNVVIAAIYLLIESLELKKSELDSPEGRTEWLKRVHTYRPVVESVFKTCAEDNDQQNDNLFKKARLLWNRVVIVKLFMEHVCVANNSDKITIKHCMPLWNILKEKSDMKEIPALKAIEKFLKACNSTAQKQYLGYIEKCSICEKTLEGDRLIMPCNAKVCEVCMLEGKIDGMCKKCSEPLPDNFEPVISTDQREAESLIKDYQRRCNTFFMDAVSQLCFIDSTPPSKEVVTRLLSYITVSLRQPDGQNLVTKPMSVFETGIDPTPVFRSFLLQHLLRSSDVNELLEQYLGHAQQVLTQQKENEACNQHYIQLSLLVIQCLEDLHRSQALADEVTFATHRLQQSLRHLHEEGLTTNKLCSIAGARMGLGVAADCIRKSVQRPLNHQQTKLLKSANTLCIKDKWALTYLVKYFCRSYGVDTYHKLCNEERYQWLRLECMDIQRIEIPDRYIILGETYKALRECLTHVILSENVKQLTETYQGLNVSSSHMDLMLQLAMHREVTSARLYPADKNRIREQIIKNLDGFISSSVVPTHQDLCRNLLRNSLPGSLCVTEQEDMYTQGVQCLLLHLLCTLNDVHGDCTLAQPLIGLMKTPQHYTRCFMPTMPQDDTEEIRDALLASKDDGENPILYKCPNGHPYVIGNCGGPVEMYKCMECNADIGGENYTLLDGNVVLQGGDDTKTGHILGSADQRGEETTPERSLSPVKCAYLRLLTHLSLYLASLDHAQEMEDIFQPRRSSQDVPGFLWQHISTDLNILQNIMGKSGDDVLLIAHYVVMTIMNQNDYGEHVSQEMCLLSSKTGRCDWEQTFAQTFLQPVLQNVDAILKSCNQAIANDQRLGGDPLLCVLHETETSQTEPDPNMLQEVDEVWRFRTPISINHLRLQLQNKGHCNTQEQIPHHVLHNFLASEPILRALKYVPSILRLQKGLLHKYQRRLDRVEAYKIAFKHLKEDNVLGSETEELLDDFKNAWDIVREHLKRYACPSKFGPVWVSEDMCCSSVDDESPLAMLLPTTRDMGLCSYVLLDFLMRQQNSFLDSYNKTSTHSRSSVAPIDVTSAHLVSFDTERDIIPLIYANCQYTFALGKGTTIEYDFAGIERQLMDRFFFSKSRIEVGGYLKIELMVYRTESTNAQVFAELAEKIPQVDLHIAVKRQICIEMTSLPELCKSLDHLNIAVSFLKSIGGDPSMSLSQFVHDTLQMSSTLHSQRAQQSCQLQHAKSLWLLLALQRSKLMLPRGNRKTIIEAVPDEYTEDIPESCFEALTLFLNTLTVERLSQLVDVFHDFILLKVAVNVNRNDIDYTDNRENQLKDHLMTFVELMDDPPMETSVLDGLPSNILLKHCVHAWTETCKTLFKKQNGRKR